MLAPHGVVPSDDVVAAAGYKAFPPRRQPFVPTPEDFGRAARDVLPDDGTGEFAAVAEALAYAMAQDQLMCWYAALYGWWGVFFDDEDDGPS